MNPRHLTWVDAIRHFFVAPVPLADDEELLRREAAAEVEATNSFKAMKSAREGFDNRHKNNKLEQLRDQLDADDAAMREAFGDERPTR